MTTNRVALIEARLEKAFAPEYLLVKDQSHLHTGHAGAKDGRGHFDITIVADVFDNCGRLQGHRLVYAAMGELMKSDIHALRIHASAKKSGHSQYTSD